MKKSPGFLFVFFISLISLNLFAQSSIDQSVINKQLDYFTSQIKKYDNLPTFNSPISVITTSQYDSQKPSDALSFDCGYVDNTGKIFVCEPTSVAQKRIFTNITQAAVYYLNIAYFKYFFQTDKMPLWFKVGFASFEADLNVSDSMIKSAITKYGGYLPSFTVLNNKTLFDTNDGIAISYLWGELMNVIFGWWKYNDIETLSLEKIEFGSWTKSTDEMFKLFRRYLNIRIMESNENYRLKLQSESTHFKFYHRDAESYCMPYMKDAMEEAYAQYSKDLKIEAPKKITYGFQPECEGAKLDSITCPGRYTGGTAWSSGVSTSCADKVEDLPKFRDLARHELAHTFQFLINPSYMPAWLSEGFASFLPDGLMTDQTIRNLSGEVNARFEEAKAKIGHYPTITELEDYDFCGKNNINYYLSGLIMNDFILRKGNYDALKNAIKTKGQNFSAMNISSKQQFETAFYDSYNLIWKPKPKSLSIKKVLSKPKIDGALSEKTWEKNIVIDRKFWMDYYMNVIPMIDNSVTASVMYDEENLYIGMDIVDRNISTDTWMNQQKDGIEVDIDPDNSRGINFQENDMAFIWNVGENPFYRSSLTGATVAYSKTTQGYSVEVSIPWSKLKVTPTAGHKFGLELCNYDRDDSKYKGAVIFSGHSWNNGIVLNGLAEITLSAETITLPKSCSLINPAGGQVFVTGEKELIQWNTASIQNINVELSTDDGTSWSRIASSIPASPAYTYITIPGILTEKGKLRIVDSADNSISSVTEGYIKIVRPVKRFGPYLNDSNTLFLMSFNLTTVVTGTYLPGVGGPFTYPASVSPTLGNAITVTASPITLRHLDSYNLTGDWTIEAWIKLNAYPATDAYIIRKPGDTDNYFSNFALEVNPYWGNIFYGFYFDKGNNRIGLSGFTPELKKWYHVTFIRDTQKSQIRLNVHDENRKSVFAQSYTYTGSTTLTNLKDVLIGENFPGSIDELRVSNIVRDFRDVELTSLNSGEVLNGNSVYTISWNAFDITNIKLEYTSDSGSTWNTITTINALTGNYSWKIPNINFQTCRIRISDQSDPTINTESAKLFSISQQVGIEDENIPSEFVLYQNYPNPFNPDTSIKFVLPKQSFVDLRLYDLTGKEIRMLLNKTLSAGSYTIQCDLQNQSSGIYYFQMKAGEFISTKKLMLLK